MAGGTGTDASGREKRAPTAGDSKTPAREEGRMWVCIRPRGGQECYLLTCEIREGARFCPIHRFDGLDNLHGLEASETQVASRWTHECGLRELRALPRMEPPSRAPCEKQFRGPSGMCAGGNTPARFAISQEEFSRDTAPRSDGLPRTARLRCETRTRPPRPRPSGGT